MRDVHRVIAGVGDGAGICAIGGDRAAVGLGGFVVAPDALVDVRWHVHEVAGAGHQRADAIGGTEGFLRMRRGLDGVDVKVVGTRVIRRAREDALERGHRLRGAGRGRAVGLPEPPRP